MTQPRSPCPSGHPR